MRHTVTVPIPLPWRLEDGAEVAECLLPGITFTLQHDQGRWEVWGFDEEEDALLITPEARCDGGQGWREWSETRSDLVSLEEALGWATAVVWSFLTTALLHR